MHLLTEGIFKSTIQQQVCCGPIMYTFCWLVYVIHAFFFWGGVYFLSSWFSVVYVGGCHAEILLSKHGQSIQMIRPGHTRHEGDFEESFFMQFQTPVSEALPSKHLRGLGQGRVPVLSSTVHRLQE